MFPIWTFSPSSEELLQKCLAAASPPDVNNKWMLAFGNQSQEAEPKHNLTCSTQEQTPAVISCNVEVRDDIQGYEELIDTIETDPESRWDYIVEECMKNPKLFFFLADRVSAPSIEKLCKHILAAKNLDGTFVDDFCKLFIPNCIKREYNRFYLDFFVGIYKMYPRSFKTLLEILLQDIDIPSKMLSDFIIFLNDNEQKEFLKSIIYIKLSAELFVHHLPTIYNTYQISKKTDEIDDYIFSNITQFSAICTNDRNYGKLFLAYLQNQKSKNKVLNVEYLKNILDSHKTPFRKPCENILNDMTKL